MAILKALSSLTAYIAPHAEAANHKPSRPWLECANHTITDVDGEAPQTPSELLEELRDDKRVQALPDDLRWLKRLLMSVHHNQRADLLERYQTVWITAAEEAHVPDHQKQNIGRYTANIHIRKACETPRNGGNDHA